MPLNGEYATARSAGNYLAGFYARHGILTNAIDQFGIKDVLALAGVVLGQEWVTKAKRLAGSTFGTSPLSKVIREVFSKRFKRSIWAPTGRPKMLGGRGIHWTAKTPVLGAAVARWVPYLGWAILGYDAGAILYNTIDDYQEVLSTR